LESELTDLILAAVQDPVYILSLLWVEKSPELGLPEVAAAALRCLGMPPKETPGVVRFEENNLPVVFSVPSFVAVLLWRVCNPDNWRDELSLPPPNGSCSMLKWKIFPSLGTPCAGGRLPTTNNEEVAYS
jgi:hypothetical protein